MIHYQMTYEEARQEATHKWIDPGDYRKQPWMLCRTGDGHAVGTRNDKQVTCPTCKKLRSV